MKFLPHSGDSVIRTLGILVGGLGLGAALMYVLDPERGKKRRATVRDKALSGAKRAGSRLAARSRDVANRARGAAAEVASLTKSGETNDPVLEERVRAELGRVVARPASIGVASFAGTVVLSGAVRADEVDDLISAVRGVSGVEDIENRLEVYDTSEEVRSRAGSIEREPKTLDPWEPAEADG